MAKVGAMETAKHSSSMGLRGGWQGMCAFLAAVGRLGVCLLAHWWGFVAVYDSYGRGKCHRSQLCILVAFATQPQPGILEAFEIHATLTTPTPPSRCEAAFQPPLTATRNSRCVRCVLRWTNRWLASASGAAISLRSPARALIERCPEGLPIEIECARCVALPSSAAP